MFKAKIIKCSSKNFWYQSAVGKVYKMVDDGYDRDSYCVLLDNEELSAYYVKKADCKKVRKDANTDKFALAG